jgi:ABC-type transport system involved in multi-copper enzyme maturation permease subunit
VFARVPVMSDWLIVATILLGVVFAGQEFPWGVVHASLARGVPRVRLWAAKFVALAALLACYVAVLWLSCALFGLWTTRALRGALDWPLLIAPAFWQAQVGIVARTWLIAVCAMALTLAVNVWVGRPGPAFGLRFLSYLLGLMSYFFVMLLPMLVLMRPSLDLASFGDTVWGRLVALLPTYNMRIVAHWGEPGRLFEVDHMFRDLARLIHLRYDPRVAVGLVVLYGVVPLALALWGFCRREMRP